MNNSIILASCLCGSFYLCSQTLSFTNKAILENKRIPRKLVFINGFTFLVCGSIIICCFQSLQFPRVCSIYGETMKRVS